MSDKAAGNDKALIVTREVDGHPFGHRDADGYFNATAMCQAVGKLPTDFLRQKGTKRFLRNLETVMGIPITELRQVVRGGHPEEQGTWVHPRVAIQLASCLSPEFEALVPGWVEDWWRQQGERQASLKEWISPELRPWVHTFPRSFYDEIYRLKGWSGPVGPQHPSVVGHYTNDIVYARLTPGLLEMLRIKNPERKNRHHQWLTEREGYPRLEKHLHAVETLMRSHDDWKEFRMALDRALPVVTNQLSLFESQKREKEMTLWE